MEADGLLITTSGALQADFLNKEDDTFVIAERDQCYCCWLASPHSGRSNLLCYVCFNASFYTGAGNYAEGSLGIRPIIKLKKGVKIVEGPDGNYEIDGSGCTE